MAGASVSLAVSSYPSGVDNTQRRQVIYGTASVIQGDGTSPATGIALNWAAVQALVGSGTLAPQWAEFQPNNAAVTGQNYTYNAANNALLVWHAGTPVASGILNDSFQFKAEFIRGV